MRSLTLAAIGCFAAASVHAQITYLSDSRSVSAYAALGTTISSQSVTASPPFADFNASAQASTTNSGPGANAGQVSSLSPYQLYYSAYVGAGIMELGSGTANGASRFSVSFSVTNPIAYTLTCTNLSTMGGASIGWTLSGSSQGIIIGGSGAYYYSGTFLPDQAYTLEASVLAAVNGLGSAAGSLTVVCVGHPPLAPVVWTLSATAVTPTNATLNGMVNPNGWPTTAWFQWGTTTNYGNLTPVTDMGRGINALALSAPLAGLTLGTTYHFRAAATNFSGAVYGTDQILTALPPPEVWTLSATAITSNSATLNGMVNPNGYLTAAWFQWGITTNYGSLTASTGMGSGTNALALSVPLAGLTPGAIYHFRVVATNSPFAVYGSDQSFTTVPAFTDADWVSLGSGMNNFVYALAVSGTDLYVGGEFTTAGGVPANSIAKWDGSTWSALGSGMGNMGVWPGEVFALAVSGTDLYAGGYFTTAGGVSANFIAKWDGSAWSALGSGMSGAVYGLAVIGTNLYVGGVFNTAGGVTAKGIARWDGSARSALGSGLGRVYPYTPSVYALAVSGTNLYAGGDFTTAGGLSATNIAKWDGSSWSALGSGVGSPVVALAVNGTDLYAGGHFTNAGGVTANYIAKWDGSAWSALGSEVNGTVSALAVSGTNLYAGGSFPTAGGVSATNIAKWDGSAWSALGSGLNNVVYALAAGGMGHLFVGGAFTRAGTNACTYLAQANLGSVPTSPLPPEVYTLSATAVTTNSAALNGKVIPNGWPTTAWFQWGTTTNYGSLTSVTALGSGTTSLPLSAPLAGLTPSVTYHFRVAATNDNGLAYGSDQSFATESLEAPFNYMTNNGTITITGYRGQGGAVTIPDTINGLPVTSIGTNAFYASTSLTSVTIPDSVTSIRFAAFYNCTSLTSVTIGSSVTSIDVATFQGCTSLTSVTIPNSVTSIGDSAFWDCTSLTSVTIGSGITSIGNGAFWDCTSLTALHFGGNAPSLGGSAVFQGDNHAAVYYLPGTTGWGATFGGRPTALWIQVPTILIPPRTQTAEAGSAVGFSVHASSPLPLFYLWYLNNTNLTSCSTNCDLELTNVQFSGAYTVVISNVLGAVTSAPAMLQVIAPVERRPVPGVKVTGQTGSALNVDYADFLSPAPNWTPLGSVSLTSSSGYCFDPTLPLPAQRFYRAWQTTPPSQPPTLDLHWVPAITLTGTVGSSVRVDCINRFGPIDAWSTLATVTLTNTSQLYFDVSAPGQPQRLYRIVPVP